MYHSSRFDYINPFLLTDGYKTGHHMMYPKNTLLVYSNFTPRSGKWAGPESKGVISFGQQMVMRQIFDIFRDGFFSRPKKEVISEIETEYSMYLNMKYDASHISRLWDLGYLPLEVKTLEEGTFVPYGVPVLTVVNTDPDFYWLTNFLETLISNMLWLPMTSATTAFEFKKLLVNYAKETDKDNVEFTQFQGHNFGMRGMGGINSAEYAGIGHSTSFSGDDSLSTIRTARRFYDETGFVVGSIPATEHSVMCAGGADTKVVSHKARKGYKLVDAINNFQGSFDELYDLCKNHIEGKSVISDGHHKTSDDRFYGFIEVEKGKIISLGEHNPKNGGIFWSIDMEDDIPAYDEIISSELLTFRYLMDQFPTGPLSIVSDTWNLWDVCKNAEDGFLYQLKNEILARDGKIVIRPDSGDPVDIICGRLKPESKVIDFSDENCDYESWYSYALAIARGEHDPKDEILKIEGEYYIPGNITEMVMDYSWENGISDCVMDIDSSISHSLLEKVEFKEGDYDVNAPENKGVIELLWEIFGGTINSQGFKVLDPHIGAIYGDSITLDRAKQICDRLIAKGFATTNIVLGIGSFTYQHVTRDVHGFAMKATYIELSECNKSCMMNHPESPCTDCMVTVGREIYKDPITDSGKKSAKGLIRVKTSDKGYEAVDQQTWEGEKSSVMKTIFKDGEFVNPTTLTEVREKVNELV